MGLHRRQLARHSHGVSGGKVFQLGLLKKACIACVLCVALAIVAHAQTFTTLYSFDGTDGQGPSSLVQGTDGNFYGTTSSGGANATCSDGLACGTIFEITPASAYHPSQFQRD
jgi:hypothetical protein